MHFWVKGTIICIKCWHMLLIFLLLCVEDASKMFQSFWNTYYTVIFIKLILETLGRCEFSTYPALGYVLNFFNTIYQRSPDLVSPQCVRPNFGLSAQCVGRRYVYYQKHFGVLLLLSYLCYFLTECYETLHSLQVCSEILSYIKHTKFYSSNLSGTKIVVQDHSF